MSKRISHSLLDPWLGPQLKKLYPYLKIPRQFPPEGIILTGHLLAISGAVGFAWSTSSWWGGILAACGVAGNHLADCLDGTHARSTGQCRNGGELLDHFTDPVSFSYWLIGIAVSCGRLDLGLAQVVLLFAIAVLTNIKAKMTGEFTLATFGPTELKAGLCLYGLFLGSWQIWKGGEFLPLVAVWFSCILIGAGAIQLAVSLVRSVHEVNQYGPPPDTSEWENTRQ